MLPIQKQEEHSPDMIPLNDKVVSNPESVAYILIVPKQEQNMAPALRQVGKVKLLLTLVL